MRDYGKMFKAGKDAQLEKLVIRTHHGPFPRNIWKLYFLLIVEVFELGFEVLIMRMKGIRLEAADISNYAHMIILECERRLDNA